MVASIMLAGRLFRPQWSPVLFAQAWPCQLPAVHAQVPNCHQCHCAVRHQRRHRCHRRRRWAGRFPSVCSKGSAPARRLGTPLLLHLPCACDRCSTHALQSRLRHGRAHVPGPLERRGPLLDAAPAPLAGCVLLLCWPAALQTEEVLHLPEGAQQEGQPGSVAGKR
jgi:hypothetical protein